LAALAKKLSQFGVELDNGISPTAFFNLIFWVWQAIACVACQFVQQIKFYGIKIADVNMVTTVGAGAGHLRNSWVPEWVEP